MNFLARLLLSQFLLLAWASSVGAAPTLFDSDAVLDVELRGPLAATTRDRRDPEERAFTLVVNGIETPVMVQARGKSRLVLCRFAPLRFDFNDATVEDPVFAGLGKVKIVTHCGDRAGYHDDVLEEYVAYRIFNMLTDKSHRVRLLRVRYLDTEKPGREPLETYAFAIEPVDLLAARTGTEVAGIEGLVRSRINREQAAHAFVFQYMIANRDWSLVSSEGEVECCHNGEVLTDGAEEFIVPYDFDLSGFVYAGYARRSQRLNAPISRKRKYTGYCLDELPLEASFAAAAGIEEELMTLVESLEWTESKRVAERTEFLQSFFVEVVAVDFVRRMGRSCAD